MHGSAQESQKELERIAGQLPHQLPHQQVSLSVHQLPGKLVLPCVEARTLKPVPCVEPAIRLALSVTRLHVCVCVGGLIQTWNNNIGRRAWRESPCGGRTFSWL